MLHSAKAVKTYTLAARDGPIGRIEEFYFDDARWAIRYAVIQAGNWLTGRMVLLTPQSLGFPAAEAGSGFPRTITANLTRKEIVDSPSPETDRPVSRQFEEEYYRHFGWPYYWAGPYLWGPSPFPMPADAAFPAPVGAGTEEPYGAGTAENAREGGPYSVGGGGESAGDPHLRSTDEVAGYRIRARDGEIGHVDDFLFDPEDWSIRYISAATRHWLPGRHVLVPRAWITGIDWEARTVEVEAERETIRLAPGYDPGRGLSEEEEARVEGFFSAEVD